VDARAGFTLVEALVALTISGALVIMVGALFLAQNEFYSWLLLRTQVQENARAMTELVGSEIRSVPRGGVVLADSLRLVVRSPMVSGSVCGFTGTDGYVYVPGGSGAIDQTDLASLGALNSTTGVWTFYDTTWGTLNATGGTPAATCATNGADTAGVSSSYLRLKVGTVTGAAPAVGDILMLGRKTEFKIQASTLDSTQTALYRGNYGGTLTEFATGLGSTARFQFRYGTTTHYNVVTGANLALVDGIRIIAQSTGRGESGAQTQYAFGWTVDVPLVNAR
jgi:hypothetical protein